MKKLSCVFLTVLLILSLSATAFAAENRLDNENNRASADVHVEYVKGNVYIAPVEDSSAEVTTKDGITVSVTEAPENAKRLVIIPVPESETDAWEWFTESLGDEKSPVHAFDIHFEDAAGNRINADDAEVSISCPHCDKTLSVNSLDTDGTVRTLASTEEGDAVTFVTDGGVYYILSEDVTVPENKYDVTVEDSDDGEVSTDNATPAEGETVTITVTPEEGKVVKEVIITDAAGNKIAFTDNGDGTYSYCQPSSDVTVRVVFADKVAPPPTSDNAQVAYYSVILLLSLTTFAFVLWKKRSSQN